MGLGLGTEWGRGGGQGQRGAPSRGGTGRVCAAVPKTPAMAPPLPQLPGHPLAPQQPPARGRTPPCVSPPPRVRPPDTPGVPPPSTAPKQRWGAGRGVLTPGWGGMDTPPPSSTPPYGEGSPSAGLSLGTRFGDTGAAIGAAKRRHMAPGRGRGAGEVSTPGPSDTAPPALSRGAAAGDGGAGPSGSLSPATPR